MNVGQRLVVLQGERDATLVEERRADVDDLVNDGEPTIFLPHLVGDPDVVAEDSLLRGIFHPPDRGSVHPAGVLREVPLDELPKLLLRRASHQIDFI